MGACLGKINAKEKGNPVILSSRRHMTLSATVNSSLWLQWHRAPALMERPFSFVSSLRSMGLVSVGTSCSSFYHPNHMEHSLPSWQSLEPLEGSLLYA